jgi:hypothetical protein
MIKGVTLSLKAPKKSLFHKKEWLSILSTLLRINKQINHGLVKFVQYQKE